MALLEITVIFRISVASDEEFNIIIEKGFILSKKEGCLSCTIFQNSSKSQHYTIFSNWNNVDTYSRYTKSESYQNISKILKFPLDHYSEVFKSQLYYKFSNEESDCYSIQRIYVEDFYKNIKSFENAYNHEKTSELGIYNIRIFTPLSSNRRVLFLTNWRGEKSRNYYENQIIPQELAKKDEFGIIGSDSYKLKRIMIDV